MAEIVCSLSGASSDISCPATGEVCPAMSHVAGLYTESVDPTIAASLPAALNPNLNAAKLAVKLTEMRARAQIGGCHGPEGSVCEVRQRMDSSIPRQRAVSGIRRLLRMVRQRTSYES